MRKRQIYIDKYGPVAGPKLYRALQSQAAHAGVSARLRRKIAALQRGEPWPPARPKAENLPLFPEPAPRKTDETPTAADELKTVGCPH
jgi:hypothetical protein